MIMPSRRKAAESYAAQQGYSVIGDDELLRIAEGRVARLEADLAGERLFRAELDVDPNATEKQVEDSDKLIDSLEKRLAVLREHHETVKAAVEQPGADGGDG
jgi:hypothetical protein